jgi:hypothetical protein
LSYPQRSERDAATPARLRRLVALGQCIFLFFNSNFDLQVSIVKVITLEHIKNTNKTLIVACHGNNHASPAALAGDRILRTGDEEWNCRNQRQENYDHQPLSEMT